MSVETQKPAPDDLLAEILESFAGAVEEELWLKAEKLMILAEWLVEREGAKP